MKPRRKNNIYNDRLHMCVTDEKDERKSNRKRKTSLTRRGTMQLAIAVSHHGESWDLTLHHE